MGAIQTKLVNDQLERVREVAQKPSRLLSPDTFLKVEEHLRNHLKSISSPNSIYFTNRKHEDLSLDLKSTQQLSESELQEISSLVNSYGYSPQVSLEEQSKRGFIGSPFSSEPFNYTPEKIKQLPYKQDWLLVKAQDRIVALMASCPFDKETPEWLLKKLVYAWRRPPLDRGFFRMLSVVDPKYKGKKIFRLMLEVFQKAYNADFSVSTVFPSNKPSIEANYSVGAEDVGALEKEERLFVLDFKKYIKSGQEKPVKILYPFIDQSGNYPNFSNPFSHTEVLGTLHAVDFPLPIGTDLRAVANGTVYGVYDSNPDKDKDESSSDMDPEKANYIDILGDDGLMQQYVHIAHNSSKVKVGDKVKAGDLICKSGHNGASTEPHLHFHLLKKDPSKSLGFNSVPVRFINPTVVSSGSSKNIFLKFITQVFSRIRNLFSWGRS